jgi:hypothetical protein
MGDLSLGEMKHVGLLAAMLIPCFILVFWFSNAMNLLLMGKEMAQTMGVNIRVVTGLIGFVGLVMPHLLRLVLGPDQRILVPACVLGGGAYMVLCDTLARVLPEQGEMPAGVITAMNTYQKTESFLWRQPGVKSALLFYSKGELFHDYRSERFRENHIVESNLRDIQTSKGAVGSSGSTHRSVFQKGIGQDDLICPSNGTG